MLIDSRCGEPQAGVGRVAYAHWSPDVAGLEVQPCVSRAGALALLADLRQAVPGASCCLFRRGPDGQWRTLTGGLTPGEWRAAQRA